MEHTQIVSANELESFSDTRISESVIPELIWCLIKRTDGLIAIRMPYGDSVNQVGLDGSVETKSGFSQYVPSGKSYWEIGTGIKPQTKATTDFRKRTKEIATPDRANCSFVFVTPRSGGTGGWTEPQQRKWLQRRKSKGWRDIIIIDGVRLADWLREFPAIGKWLAKKMELTKSIAGFWTATEHWDLLQQCRLKDDPILLPKVFMVGRDQACSQLARLFEGKSPHLAIAGESESDTMDFVAAFLASLDPKIAQSYVSKCLFFDQDEAWLSMSGLTESHILVAHPSLDLESRGERLYSVARKNRHFIIYQTSNAAPTGGENLVRISSPSASLLESVLLECGYAPSRAKEAASAGAASLDALKRHLRGQSGPPPYATGANARALAFAEMFCRWSGQNPTDRETIEDFLRGKSYGEWIETIQNEALRPGAPLSQRDDVWKFVSRSQAWSALGSQLFNDDLTAFQKIALKVLSEPDPKLDLDPEDRYAASIHGKVFKHSSYLREGISDTMALLGSRPEWLTQCTVNQSEQVAALIVRQLLHDADWKRWASLKGLLPLLAEASPEQFLDAVEGALNNASKSPFAVLFEQERPGLTGGNYMTGLLWALEVLAWDKNYLTRVTMVLGELSGIDPGGNWANRPSNSLGTIFMPWFPQTCASISVRIAAIKSLAKELPEVAWKLLLRLLPDAHGVSSGAHKPIWRDFIPATHSEKQTGVEYFQQIMAYADMAITTASNDVQKLAELIEKLPNLPADTPQRVLNHLVSAEVLQLPLHERSKLWESLVDLALRHRKFADANWSMKPPMVRKIEETAAKLAPDTPSLLHRRLFSERDFDLMEEKGSFQEQQENLNRRRKDAVKEILDTSGIEDLIEFAKQVASPWQVGFALGGIGGKKIDVRLLPNLLLQNQPIEQLIGGYIWAKFYSNGEKWVDELKPDLWQPIEKAIFLAHLPFQKSTWDMVDRLLGQNQDEYWARINPNPFSAGDHIIEAVVRFHKHGRGSLAIQGLNALVHNKTSFPVDLAIEVLTANMTSEEKRIDPHDIVVVIKWLQDHPTVDADLLCKIEWAYLPLLDRLLGNPPKTLERMLANSPSFFCQVIQAVFKSRKEERSEKSVSDEQRGLAENAYRLLQQWQTVPGTDVSGDFNPAAFKNWLDEVKKICNESGHLDIALNQVGEVLPYSPIDESGLWIHKAIAEALNGKDAEKMRSGFTCELFNMRGVHGFSAGAEELKLALNYGQRAEKVEAEGYHRLAASIKSLAASYEADAHRQKNLNPYED